MASECNFPRAFRKKSTHRAKSSYPRCQHSCSEIIFAKKPPKRRNMPGICLTKQSQPLEYHHIPHWSAGTVPQDPLYSAEYSGTRSFGGPSIFRKKFRNIWQRPTSGRSSLACMLGTQHDDGPTDTTRAHNTSTLVLVVRHRDTTLPRAGTHTHHATPPPRHTTDTRARTTQDPSDARMRGSHSPHLIGVFFVIPVAGANTRTQPRRTSTNARTHGHAHTHARHNTDDE